MQHKLLEKCSIWLALYDFVPCLLFAISMTLIYILYPSNIFVFGAILSSMAGFFKAGWKLVLALTRKKIPWLQKQFKYNMISGVFLMVLSVIVDSNLVNFPRLLKEISTFPVYLLLLFTFFGYGGMSYCKKHLDSSKISSNYIEQTLNTLIQLSFLTAIVLMYLSVLTYTPASIAYSYLESSDNVTVTDTKDGYYFDGNGEDLFIFYPGALVDPISYSELCYKLADQGLDCYLIRMPLNLAITDIHKADDILTTTPHQKSFIGGHSLGGAMAATCSYQHDIDGLILLGAYSTKPQSIPVLSIHGSEDKVLNINAYQKYYKNISNNLIETIIEGANHAGFASYGTQKGDGKSTITQQSQVNITVEQILSFISK